MKNDMLVNDTLATDFKTNLQTAYDYLEECSNINSKYDVLQELGFCHNTIDSLNRDINDIKEKINIFCDAIYNYQNWAIDTDQGYSDELKKIMDE